MRKKEITEYKKKHTHIFLERNKLTQAADHTGISQEALSRIQARNHPSLHFA